jgi:AcrR family transcriptional regulator
MIRPFALSLVARRGARPPMDAPARRRPTPRQPAEKRVADILTAARAVLAERGPAETLVADIAARAGVVEGSLYRYFRNKRDLLERVAEHWFEELLAGQDAGFAMIAGRRDRLRYLVFRHLDAIRRDPALARLVLQDLRPDAAYRASRLFALNRAYTGRLIELVREGIAAGELRPDLRPGLVRDMVFGCIEHRTWAFLRNEGDFDAAATAEGIAEMVWRAMERPAADPLAPALDRLEQAAARLEALSR